MSLVPWPIALEPSMSTSPAFMNALTSVRRVIRPPPYELVRHSELARLPEAPLGYRLALPAAATGMDMAASARSAMATATAAALLLRNRGTHEQSLRVGPRDRIPHAGAGDQRQRRGGARSEQRGDPLAGADALQRRHPKEH